MSNIPSITYIKNGKEKKITINKLTEKLVFTILSENINIPLTEEKISSHKLLSQVTFIHIKNYNFKKSVQFSGEFDLFFKELDNTTIILENCTLDGNMYFNHIKKITIIDPILTKHSNIYIGGLEGCEPYLDIRIDLTNSKGELNLQIEQAQKVKIISSDCLKKLRILYSNYVTIKNMNNTIVDNLFDIKNLKLINSNMIEFFPNRNETVPFKVFSLDYFKITNQISLENSKLVLPRNFELKNNQVISLNNSIIISDYILKIPNTNFIDFVDSTEDSILDNSSYIEAKELIINNQPYKSNILTIKDKQELTPTITYIENNKKETLDFVDKYLDNSTSYIITPMIDKNTLTINNNIELIHFKNISFKNVQDIKLNKNQTLILENCEFINNHIYYTLHLNGGNIKLINPSLNGNITATNINNFIVDFTNELSKDNIFIKTINVKNFIINNNDNLQGLDISSKSTYLKNFGLLGDYVNIDTENLVLKNTILSNDFNNEPPKTKIRRK